MVFLGFGMDLPVVLRTGFEGAGLAGVTIATTLGLGWMLGEQFDINRKISALISAGTAICGLIRGRGRRRARGRGVHANSIGSGCLSLARSAWKKEKDASSPVRTVDQGLLQMCHFPFLGLELFKRSIWRF
jgi:hypothetical protein